MLIPHIYTRIIIIKKKTKTALCVIFKHFLKIQPEKDACENQIYVCQLLKQCIHSNGLEDINQYHSILQKILGSDLKAPIKSITFSTKKKYAKKQPQVENVKNILKKNVELR